MTVLIKEGLYDSDDKRGVWRIGREIVVVRYREGERVHTSINV